MAHDLHREAAPRDCDFIPYVFAGLCQYGLDSNLVSLRRWPARGSLDEPRWAALKLTSSERDLGRLT